MKTQAEWDAKLVEYVHGILALVSIKARLTGTVMSVTVSDESEIRVVMKDHMRMPNDVRYITTVPFDRSVIEWPQPNGDRV